MRNSTNSIPRETGPVPLVIGVTGHQDLPFGAVSKGDKKIAAVIENEVREFFDHLNRDYPRTPFILLSTLSPGAECLVARIALDESDARLVPVLPAPIEQHIDANGKALKTCYPFSLSGFDSLRNHERTEKEHIVMPEVNCVEAPLLENSPGITNIRHVLASTFVARYSQILVVLWDEKRTSGGTAQNVHFQRTGECQRTEELEKCLQGIDEPYWFKPGPVDEPETGLVYHIDTRDLENRKPHDQRFLGREGSSERNRKDYVSRFNKIHENIDTFNSDALRLLPLRTDKLSESASYLFSEAEAPSLPGLQELRNKYAAADVLAVHFRDWTNRALAAMFWLVGIAAASFVYYAHLAEPAGRYWLLGGYLLLLVVAIVLYFLVRWRNLQNKYQDYRALAEGLRVGLFWRIAGLANSASGHYLRKQKRELDWIRSAVRSCCLLAPRERVARLPLLLTHWIKEQYAYFANAAERDHKRLLRYREIGGGALLFSLVLGVYVLWDESRTAVTTALALLAAAALFAQVVSKLREIVKEVDVLPADQTDALDSAAQEAEPNASRQNEPAGEKTRLPSKLTKSDWKKPALKTLFVLPYVVSLIVGSYQLFLYLSGKGLHWLQVLPGLVVMTIGGLTLVQMRFRTSGRGVLESLISSAKNNLYGMNIGLLITLGLMESHALPAFFSHLLKLEEHDPHDMRVAAMGLTALFAALLHTYAEKRAHAETHKQYLRMKHVFARAKSRMSDLIDLGKTDEALDLVRELGKEALAEHGDWVMLHRERPIELPKAEI